MDINQAIEAEVRRRVAAELRRLLAQVEDAQGATGPKRSTIRAVRAKSTGKPVTDVARGELTKGPRTFGELWVAVERAGGGKFALRSALGKGRERGEFAFDGETYSLAQKKKAPPVPGKGRKSEATVATS
jgi:hypothetical protein